MFKQTPMEDFTSEWKFIILHRYSTEFPPYSGIGIPIQKSSEDISSDLSGMAKITLDEISAFLAINNYKISFDGAKPVWLLENIKSRKTMIDVQINRDLEEETVQVNKDLEEQIAHAKNKEQIVQVIEQSVSKTYLNNININSLSISL